MSKVIVVGAGISGLALAYRIRQTTPSVEVTVLEQNTRPGGTIWTENRDGFQVEIGANGFLDSKPATLDLCRDLGLQSELIAASEDSSHKRYLFIHEKLHLLPGSIADFVRSDLLSWRGKLRFLSERWRRSRSQETDESVDAFARRRAGSEAADIFADALVTGIHAGDPALLSVAAAFPRLCRFEADFGSVMKGMDAMARSRKLEAAREGRVNKGPPKLWSFPQGLRALIEGLRTSLGNSLVLGAKVARVEKTADSTGPAWAVHGGEKDRWLGNSVVLACPSHQQALLLSTLDPELSRKVGEIAYNRVVVAALGYRQSDLPTVLDGFGFIAPQRTRRDVLGVQWCSSIFPGRAPDGSVLVRAMCGGWNRPEMVDWSDDQLLEAVRNEIRVAMGITASPCFHHVVRWHQAIPQYHVGHLVRVSEIEAKLQAHRGLFLGGNAYHGVALNDCVEQAAKLAKSVVSFLKT